MTKPKGATHYDFKKSCFYKINEKFYKYNGFGWCEVKEILRMSQSCKKCGDPMPFGFCYTCLDEGVKDDH